jgi:hypothetical protein
VTRRILYLSSVIFVGVLAALWFTHGMGPQEQGIYEDRLAMLVDDGSVPEFGRYGGYATVGDRMRFFTDQATAEEVAAHPYLGAKNGETEVGKHLPATRRDINDWSSVVSEEELARYGVEAEFAGEIWRQWLLTMIGGILLIAAFAVAVNLLFRSNLDDRGADRFFSRSVRRRPRESGRPDSGSDPSPQRGFRCCRLPVRLPDLPREGRRRFAADPQSHCDGKLVARLLDRFPFHTLDTWRNRLAGCQALGEVNGITGV